MTMARARARRPDPAPHTTHSPGWPHLDGRGNCLCTLPCCLGRNGCRCPACTHQSHPAVRELRPGVLVQEGEPRDEGL